MSEGEYPKESHIDDIDPNSSLEVVLREGSIPF